MVAVAAPEGDLDEGVPWHYGDPMVEQRELAVGRAAVDLSHFGVVRVSGPDLLPWLHSLTAQHLEGLAPGLSSLALILSPHGHVEFELALIDEDPSTWIICSPGSSRDLAGYLESMKFMTRVDVEDVSEEYAVIWEPVYDVDPSYPTWLVPVDFAGSGSSDAGFDKGGDASKYVSRRPAALIGREVIVPRGERDARLDEWPSRAGTWAWNALRVAAAVPRVGFETDHRTLPHEVGWIGSAVHLSKGCYRGQEAVARVHNLGHPPRRLALVHLDGSVDELPAHGATVTADGREIGWVASSAHHFEEGHIATVVVKRSTPTDAILHIALSADPDDESPVSVLGSQTPVVSA